MKCVQFTFVLLICLACLSCGEKELTSPELAVGENDPEMMAAVEQARKTIGEFVVALQGTQPGEAYFSLKVPISDGDVVKQVWIDDITYKDRVFAGAIANEEIDLQGLKNGDYVSVARSDITDWMIVENKTLRGGFTLHVLRNRMNPEEQAVFDEMLGLSDE